MGTAKKEAAGAKADEKPKGVDAEKQHSTAIERMENMADDLEIDTSEMVFDVRDFLLDTIKARPKPWSATSQAEQRDVAAACEHSAKQLVRKVAEAIATNGQEAVRVLLTKVAMGSDIVISGKVKAFGEGEEDRAVALLHHSLNKHIMVMPASADDYAGGDREAETDEDQTDFGFEAGDDDFDDGDFSDPDPVADAAVDAALGQMAKESEKA